MSVFETQIFTLLVIFGSGFFLFFLHLLACRLWIARNVDLSPQKITAAIALALNLPILAVLFYGFALLETPNRDMIFGILYSFIIFNCSAYAYFHIFNLSETGRRIRILLELLEPESFQKTGSKNILSEEKILDQRLVRLTQMGQIQEINGRYHLKSRFLLRVARLLERLRFLVEKRSI